MTGYPLDHLVYGVPDLLAGVSLLRNLTGVEPVPGGRHEKQGTANYLLGLGAGAYLEIIGPDPDAAHPPRWFDLAHLRAPRLLTWAIRPDDLDACVASARAAGYDPGDAAAMSRRTGTGEQLNWRLTPDTVRSTGGTVPFLIDWGASRRPSSAGLPQLRLRELTVLTATPDRTRAQLAALGAPESVAVERATETGLRCVLDTLAGPITLNRSLAIGPAAWDAPDAVALRVAMSAEIDPRYVDRATTLPVPPQMQVDPHDVAYVGLAYLGTRAIGHVALRRLANDVEMKRLFVDSAFRGHGAGLALLEAAERAARELGWSRIILQTGDRQPEATALYERAGYRRIPIFAPYLDLPYSLCFEKHLAAGA